MKFTIRFPISSELYSPGNSNCSSLYATQRYEWQVKHTLAKREAPHSLKKQFACKKINTIAERTNHSRSDTDESFLQWISVTHSAVGPRQKQAPATPRDHCTRSTRDKPRPLLGFSSAPFSFAERRRHVQVSRLVQRGKEFRISVLRSCSSSDTPATTCRFVDVESRSLCACVCVVIWLQISPSRPCYPRIIGLTWFIVLIETDS